MGRVTKDPVMQQGRNNGTEYISLDLATSQRSQNAQNNPDNPYESVFYQCYLNKHLAERLSKAGVKKGTCLYIYGDLELHPFVYSQGQRAGQAGSGAKINVRDWQFCLSNKSEGDAGGNQAGAPPYNGGAATPGAGGYPNPGPQNGGYQNPAGAAQGGAYPANGNAAGNGNYPVIAGIAIAGITGSLLFLLIPMLPRVSVPAFLRDTHSHIQKRGKNRQKSPVFDMETLLIRQISYQITDKIKAAFPDASWEYTRPIKAESLLNCEIIRIRTFHTGDYT